MGTFFPEATRANTDKIENIRDSIGYVCSNWDAFIKTASSSEFVPVQLYTNPDSKPATIPPNPEDYIIVEYNLDVTRNEIPNPILITTAGNLQLKTADTSHYSFNSITTTQKNPLDYAIDSLVTRERFESETGEFRRLRGEIAQPVILTVKNMYSSVEQEKSKDFLKIGRAADNNFNLKSVVAIRYPSQLLYDGELIFCHKIARRGLYHLSNNDWQRASSSLHKIIGCHSRRITTQNQ